MLKWIKYFPCVMCLRPGMILNQLEITQNVQRETWSEEDVDLKLKQAMRDIYRRCDEAARLYGTYFVTMI